MTRRHTLALLATLLSGALLSADGNPKSVRVVAVRVSQPPTEQDRQLNLNLDPGTHLDLVVHRPGQRILGLDRDASKLTRFSDDKQTDLSKAGPFGWLTDLPARSSPDGLRLALRVHSPAVPAAGATRLSLQGTLALVVGSAEQTAEAKDITPKAGGELPVGPFQLRKGKGDGFWEAVEATEALVEKTLQGLLPWELPKRKKGGLWRETVILTHPQPNITGVVFLDQDGKIIPSKSVGSIRSSALGATTYKTGYRLKGKLKGVTVRVTYFSKVETVTVPFELSVGLGF